MLICILAKLKQRANNPQQNNLIEKSRVELPTSILPAFFIPQFMNKRQKKKREKKILLWTLDQDKPKIERYGIDFNHEGYRDSTAAAAIRNVMKDERVR